MVGELPSDSDIMSWSRRRLQGAATTTFGRKKGVRFAKSRVPHLHAEEATAPAIESKESDDEYTVSHE